MDIQQYEKIIIGSAKEQWTVITCWGGGGPSYLEESSVCETGAIEINYHSMRASLKTDLSIWIAWGLPSNRDFKETWANKFQDPKAGAYFIDFFYGSSLVFRDLYVSIDGGRCSIPFPYIEKEEDNKYVYKVSDKKHKFFEIFNEFEINTDFYSYFKQTDIQLTNKSWMA